jgi:hypothetical protein
MPSGPYFALTCEKTRLAAAEVHERPNEDDAGR